MGKEDGLICQLGKQVGGSQLGSLIEPLASGEQVKWSKPTKIRPINPDVVSVDLFPQTELKVGVFIGPPKPLARQRLQSLLSANSNKYHSNTHWAELLGISGERVRQLIAQFRQQGQIAPPTRADQAKLNSEAKMAKARQSTLTRDARAKLEEEVRPFILAKYSNEQIAKMLGRTPREINNARSRLRSRQEAIRARRKRRKLEEIRKADDAVRLLYNEGLSYEEMAKRTELGSRHEIGNSLNRLVKNGKITRRSVGGQKRAPKKE